MVLWSFLFLGVLLRVLMKFREKLWVNRVYGKLCVEELIKI